MVEGSAFSMFSMAHVCGGWLLINGDVRFDMQEATDLTSIARRAWQVFCSNLCWIHARQCAAGAEVHRFAVMVSFLVRGRLPGKIPKIWMNTLWQVPFGFMAAIPEVFQVISFTILRFALQLTSDTGSIHFEPTGGANRSMGSA